MQIHASPKKIICALWINALLVLGSGLVKIISDLPIRKEYMLRLQLVVDTSSRPVKYGRGRHTTIVYPRFELRLLVNRGGTRWVAIVACQATCLLPARYAKYVRLYPSTRVAQPRGNPANG